MNNMMQMVAQIKQNPGMLLGRRFKNLPQNMNKSEDIIQYLLDSGQLSQNQLNNVAMQAHNNPMLQQMYHQMYPQR